MVTVIYTLKFVKFIHAVFTARRYASAVYAVFVCLSVCLSQAGTVPKLYTSTNGHANNAIQQPTDSALQCVSKNDTALACYNFDVHQPILIFYGRSVAKKVTSQILLYFPTSPN